MKTFATNKLTHVYLKKLRRENFVATASIALIVTISLFWLYFQLGGQKKTIYFADSMYSIAAWIGSFWACRIAYRAQRGPLRLEPRQRLAWLLIGIGLLANGIGNAYYIYLEWKGKLDPVPSLADLGFTLFYLLTFTGLLCMPTVADFLLMPTIPKPKQSLIRLALDALIPTISILGISWFFVIGPIFATARDLPTLLVAVTYPFWDILLILALILLIRRHVERILFPSLLLFGVGILCQICADSGYALTIPFGTYTTGTPYIDTFWYCGSLLIGLAAPYQYAAIARRLYEERSNPARAVNTTNYVASRQDKELDRRFIFLNGLLTYLPLTILLTLTLYSEITRANQTSFFLVIIAAIVGILVSIRYLFATNEHEVLIKILLKKLQEREPRQVPSRHLAVQHRRQSDSSVKEEYIDVQAKDSSLSTKIIPLQNEAEEQYEMAEVEDETLPPADVDLGQIFIGREHQLDQFRFYLERWIRLAEATPTTRVNIIPSPNDKIQGMVVSIHGRGGFGKTILLKHFRDIALEYGQTLSASKVVDWEFAARDRLALFNPVQGEKVDALDYFRLLRDQLASALDKHPSSFTEYQSAFKAVDEARKQASTVINKLKLEDFDWLRSPVGEGVLELLRLIPGIGVVLSIEKFAEKVRAVAGEGVKIGVEQVKHVWDILHARLGTKLGDYLEPELKLAQGLGYDLSSVARKTPILILFDTYEVVDEADEFLRLVMGAAGARVGWVLAGRDNLWAGLSQRLRSQEAEYGYKDLVPPDRRLVVDFSAEGAGDFALGDIEEYFSQLCRIPRQPPLSPIAEKEAAHILEVTQGVPLAVKIAASLYFEKPDLRFITDEADSKREIVDQMVRRYLLHTRTNQADRRRLYGLAVLRRADEPTSVAAALNLHLSESYEGELSRLHRRYGFVFARNGQPTLHQEVRYFLRLYLLEHNTSPEIIAVNQQIKGTHFEALKDLEENRQYANLRERLEDERWIGLYLDLTEQQFWLDSAEGVKYALPFMIATAIYRRDANREVVKLWRFFEPAMNQPYGKYWEWATSSLVYKNSYNPLPDELTGLQALVKLASLKELDFPEPVSSFRNELEAVLWWRLAEAYQGRDENNVQKWYKKARRRLPPEITSEELAIEAVQEVPSKTTEPNEPARPDGGIDFTLH